MAFPMNWVEIKEWIKYIVDKSGENKWVECYKKLLNSKLDRVRNKDGNRNLVKINK